jgi:hypothetical protein
MRVKPPGPRHQKTNTSDGVAIRIPAKRNVFIMIFIGFWLCGWCAGAVGAFTQILRGTGAGAGPHTPPPGVAILVVWLCFWMLGGVVILFAWLWQFKGCELVTVSPTTLGIRRQIFSFGLTRTYDVSEIRELRVAPLAYSPFDFRTGMAFWGFGGGLLAFDYGFRTFRFAAGIDEAEARAILKAIVNRLPASVRSTAAA